MTACRQRTGERAQLRLNPALGIWRGAFNSLFGCVVLLALGMPSGSHADDWITAWSASPHPGLRRIHSAQHAAKVADQPDNPAGSTPQSWWQQGAGGDLQ